MGSSASRLSWGHLVLTAALAACTSNESPSPGVVIDAVVSDVPTTGDTPVTPSSCSSDLDCSAAGEVCDPLSGTCVECLFDADCGPSQRCGERACVAVTLCTTSADCDDGVCAPGAGHCVECVSDGHCGEGARCVDRACQAIQACQSSLQCSGQVCDKSIGECVDCLGDADCGEGKRCLDRACVVAISCSSDLDCTPHGKVCDKSAELCVACLAHSDCPDAYHCAANACALDVCAPGDRRCQGSEVQSCGPVGDGWVQETTCGASQHCLQGACHANVCAPGTSSCDGGRKTTCDAIGSGVADTEDCSATGKVCVSASGGATCKTPICQPENEACVGQQLGVCDATGTAWASLTDCSAGTFCQAGACAAHVCEPATTTCDGMVLTVCDQLGSAVLTSVDCADSGDVCVETGDDASCATPTCEPGTSICQSGKLRTCDGLGLGYGDPVDCPIGTWCAQVGCEPWVCTPDQVFCEDDAIRTCNGFGSDSIVTEDCGAKSQSCIVASDTGEPECAKVVCKPNEKQCSEGQLAVCNTDGTAFSSLTPCPTGTFCAEKSGPGEAACAAQLCEPGTSICLDGMASPCLPDGSGHAVPGLDCAAQGAACVDGECLPLVCDPGSITCNAAKTSLVKCSDDGTSLSVTSCGGGQFCKQAGASSACVAQVCTPGEVYCAGGLVATCDDVGSGPDDEPLSCVEGSICVEGECIPLQCEPSSVFCSADQLARAVCSDDGSSFVSVPCSAGSFCDPDADEEPACVPQVCVPSTPYCLGNGRAVCDAIGSGPTAAAVSCGDDVCLDGACVATVCEPDQSFCDSAFVRGICNATGTAFTTAPCPGGSYCSESGGGSSCAPQVCTPGATYCQNNSKLTCNPTGSGPAGAGTPCGDDVCLDGACVSTVCEADGSFCSSAFVRGVCNATGTAFTTAPCPGGSYCTESGGSSSCAPQACTPNATYCQDDTVFSCNDVGSGPSGAGTPCGDDVCLDGACVTSVCNASTSFCADAFTRGLCNATGTAFTTEACPPDRYCLASSLSSACIPQACEPGGTYCAGNSVTTCDAIGSGPAGPGTSCGDDACLDGECVPTVCEPGSTFCADTFTRGLCNESGTAFVSSPCGPGSYCGGAVLDAECLPQACIPGAAVCDGDTATVCNTAGSGPAAGGEACGDDICVAGQCVPPECSTGDVSGCDDLNPCTAESCDDGHCVNTPDDSYTETCYDGDGDLLGAGTCKSGLRTCSGGILSGCQGQVLPAGDGCDGLDNDCNGVVDDNVCHYWTMDDADTAGATMLDRAGGVHGQIEGASAGQAGLVGQAYGFDDARVTLGSAIDQGDRSFSVALWARLPAGATGRLIGKGLIGNSGVASRGWALYAESGQLHLAVRSGSIPHDLTLPLPAADTWFHAVAVVDRGNKQLRLVIDGGAPATLTYASLGSLTTDRYAALGASHPGPGSDAMEAPLTGILDDVSLYHRALSAPEITALHAAGQAGQAACPAPPCTATCGDGEVNQGFERCDDANASLCDGCEGCYRRRVVELAGDDQVTIQEGASSLGLAGHAFTVEAWIRPGGETPLTITRGTAGTTGWTLGLSTAGVRGEAHQQFVHDVAVAVSAEWHHVAWTWDQATSRLYLDGVQVGGQAALDPALASSGLVRVGHQAAPSAPGAVDELRISDVVRYHGSFQPVRRHAPDPNALGLWHFDGDGTEVTGETGAGHLGVLQGATRIADDGYGETFCPLGYRTCADIKAETPEATDGVYTIDPDEAGPIQPFDVWCDMTTGGGGWTVIAHYPFADGPDALPGDLAKDKQLWHTDVGTEDLSPSSAYQHDLSKFIDAGVLDATSHVALRAGPRVVVGSQLQWLETPVQDLHHVRYGTLTVDDEELTIKSNCHDGCCSTHAYTWDVPTLAADYDPTGSDGWDTNRPIWGWIDHRCEYNGYDTTPAFRMSGAQQNDPLKRFSDDVTFMFREAPETPCLDACDPTLRAWWRFDEGSGLAAADATSWGHDLTFDGATWTTGVDGSAAEFTDFSHRASGGDVLNDLDMPVTFTAWVWRAEDNVYILETSSSFSNYQGFWWAGNADRVEVSYGTGGSANPNNRRSARSYTPIPYQQWTHLAVVIRGPVSFTVYMDGVEQPVIYSGSGGKLIHADAPLVVGHGSSAQAQYPKNSRLDDVRIYSRALSTEEIQAIMAQGTPP